MQINPYVFYDSNCEAAFKFYEEVLGGKIEMLLRNEGGAGRSAVTAGMEEEDHARQDVDRRRGADGVRRAARPFPPAAGLCRRRCRSRTPPTPSAGSRRWPRAAPSTCRSARPSSPRASACASISSGSLDGQQPAGKPLDHDPIRRNWTTSSSLCLSMISAQTRSAFVARENRFPLFRIML